MLVHGAGGTIMVELIKKLIISNVKRRSALDGLGLDAMDDGATIPLGDYEVVVTMDGHTVDPIFFPGGDIGRLAAAGTINDLAAMGARPLAIMDSIIVEEGFPLVALEKIVKSMNDVVEEVGAAIIHGDFKVMPKGRIDKIVISTAGVGLAERGKVLKDSNLKPGDKIIVSGFIGDHGIALASVREGIEFDSALVSDVAPVWDVVEAAIKIGGVHAAKDPTRGGLSMALNEMASKSSLSIWIKEKDIPIREEVKAASEMLGLNPLEVTCEGVIVLSVDGTVAEEVLEAIKSTKHGVHASIIGEVREEPKGKVVLETIVGGKKLLEPPLGEPTPRVC
ncbi:MAG: hydrogenase expression/formation protein HypE [Nitrososphaerota archaeon]|nr:hydrogenase expression/formation protein HypE [Candidatus Nezhaarchaeota archaeon]MDW8050251.1 hydrogenase expression/formation protein HypE [Nitrososphaerota archaeon]